MRKNPTPVQRVKDDILMLSLTLWTYIVAYVSGANTVCILSMICMNMSTFQIGMNIHKLYSNEIHLNQFDELDVSTSSESSSNEYCELSLKQKEQGATMAKPMSPEQEERLNSQLKKVVEETHLRNRKRNSLNTIRTPSCTTLSDEYDKLYPVIPVSDNEDEYAGMPPLIPCVDASHPIYQVNSTWGDVPTFSKNHYLHGYEMDEID